MTIKDLGRGESLEMVQRYTRSVTFQDSLKLYRAPIIYPRGTKNRVLKLAKSTSFVCQYPLYSKSEFTL